MCFSKPPHDNSAEIARQQEEERQQRIRQGQANIDTAFAPFNDDYFKTYNQNYLDYYNPQVDEKYAQAQQDLKYNTARQGIFGSSGGNTLGERLANAYTDQRRGVASDATDATNKLRTQVESNKSDLYAQNTASADPSLAAISAAGRAGSLQSAPSYSPVGDIFAGLTGGYGSYLAGQNKALPPGYSQYFTPGATLPKGYSSGSGRVVG